MCLTKPEAMTASLLSSFVTLSDAILELLVLGPKRGSEDFKTWFRCQTCSDLLPLNPCFKASMAEIAAPPARLFRTCPPKLCTHGIHAISDKPGQQLGSHAFASA